MWLQPARDSETVTLTVQRGVQLRGGGGMQGEPQFHSASPQLFCHAAATWALKIFADAGVNWLPVTHTPESHS